MAFRRYRLVALLATSLSFAGCGGCDSCFGSAQPGDDAMVPIATTTVAPTALDAARAAADEDASRDAASDAPISTRDATAIPIPVVARPKPPPAMPMGAFQTCGVYDGPLCEKLCPKGACRQECDGVRCDLSCAGGYCSQVCGVQGTCKLSCPGGHCIQVCGNPESCTKACSGGSCE